MNTSIDKYATGIPSEHGSLKYYSLLQWRDEEFTENQKQYIVEKYKPMGGIGLTEGNIMGSSASVINFLTGLQSWFTTLADEIISEKILINAEALITRRIPLLDIHFL